jgi:hypothetical protein
MPVGQTNPLPQKARSQPLQGEPEESDALRLYFSTGSNLYELLYQRTQTGYREQRILDQPLYHVEFLSPLRELPFTGDTWFKVVRDINEGGRGTYLHLSPTYATREALGNFSRVTHALEPMDVHCIVLIRPSHTTSEIAQLREEAYHGLWHISALNCQWFEGGPPPPEPSSEIQRDPQGLILYDVFALGAHSLSPRTLGVRLLLEVAQKLGEQVAAKEDGILLLNHDPEDTLEWLMLPSSNPPLQSPT